MTRLLVHPSALVPPSQVIVAPAPEVDAEFRVVFVHPDRAAELQKAIVERDRRAAVAIDAMRRWEQIRRTLEGGTHDA